MDLLKNGKLLSDLRKTKGMTQKQVADKLGVVPKTVSKWETGHGFPDVSTLSALADILGVSEKTLLSGNIQKNTTNAGNIKRTKFYICPQCNNLIQSSGMAEIICCGKPLDPAVINQADDNHNIKITQIENDYYVEFDHEMTKEHYISFIAYICFDRMLMVRLYPEQSPAVRFPRMYKGKLYYYCNKHGLFEYKL